MDKLSCITIEPHTTAEACVIWLHGLGATNEDFVPIATALQTKASIRYLFPQAPTLPVTLNGGIPMPAWYDIFGLGFGAAEDIRGIIQSTRLLHALIDEQCASGISSTRIVLAGFSQGGAIVLHAGLRYERPLAGILALSTYLPRGKTLAEEAQAQNSKVPIFMAHGTVDPVVLPTWAETSKHQLEAHGYQVEWRIYPMPHTVSEEEIKDIEQVLNGWLPIVS